MTRRSHCLHAVILALASHLVPQVSTANASTEEPSTTAGDEPRPNIILILVDTLRADHLGIYGYERPTSPELDGFGRRNLVFSQARSQAPCTFPSVNSILTSRHPGIFLGRPIGQMGIPEGIAVLPELLREQGYRTAAVSSSPIVRKTRSTFNKEGGFDRGFEKFDESCFKKPASCVNRRALQLIDSGAAPFFLYLHYLDPHGPYQPPESHPLKFAVGYEGKDFIAAGNPRPIAQMLYRKGSEDLQLTDADWKHLIALYDEEIRYFDSQFRKLLDGLEERRLLEQTLIAVVSDHGEEFREHGDVKHCRNVFDTQIHTPLLLRIPGAISRSFPQAVQNLDLAPTFLDYAGIDTSSLKLEGRSLRPLIEAGPEGSTETRVAFSRWRSLRSVTDGRFKLILKLNSGEHSVYDLVNDPGELEDVAGAQPEALARLKERLIRGVEANEPDALHSPNAGDRITEQLRALGYLE